MSYDRNIGWKLAGISALYTTTAAGMLNSGPWGVPFGVGTGVVGLCLGGAAAFELIERYTGSRKTEPSLAPPSQPK
jgi:hypothetical protein